MLTTSLEPEGERTRVVTYFRRGGGSWLAWRTAARRLRSRLEARYARLAGLAPVQIPDERRLPVAAR